MVPTCLPCSFKIAALPLNAPIICRLKETDRVQNCKRCHRRVGSSQGRSSVGCSSTWDTQLLCALKRASFSVSNISEAELESIGLGRVRNKVKATRRGPPIPDNPRVV